MLRYKKATHTRRVCAMYPSKAEKYRAQLIAGVNITQYDGEKTTLIASLETIKIN